jgi:hypothetical protein
VVFSNEAFRKQLAIWISIDDQPFTVIECPEFQELLKLCNSNIIIPSADTVRNDILKLYKNK